MLDFEFRVSVILLILEAGNLTDFKSLSGFFTSNNALYGSSPSKGRLPYSTRSSLIF